MTSAFHSTFRSLSAKLIAFTSICAFIIFPATLSAIPVEWVSGTQETGEHNKQRHAGPGIAAETNNPSGRSKAVTWTDHSGNIWMYHGSRDWERNQLNDVPLPDRHFTHNPHHELWKYDPTTNEWTMISVVGGPPLKQQQDRAAWTADDGTLWLLTSMQLWKYDIGANWWTLEKDLPKVLSYGTKGVPDTVNGPGTRTYAVTWMDNENDIWLYGGYSGIAAGQPPLRSHTDTWEYDTSEGTWTWQNGSNQPVEGANFDAVFGVKGVPAPSNHPSAYESFSSEDHSPLTDSSGNLWLYQHDNLWKYHTDINQWAWMSGHSISTHQDAFHGIMGVPDAANTPGIRYSATTWMGADDNIWLYGGWGTDRPTSDLWKFDTSTSLWVWVSGPSSGTADSVYNGIGTPAPENRPSGRDSATAWVSDTGKLYMFGGEQFLWTFGKNFNDLWNYDPTNGMWTFLKGSNGQAKPANFGEANIPSPSTSPGTRKGASTSQDSNGGLWMFGGAGPGFSRDTYYPIFAESPLGGLWRYDTVVRQWTYKGGTDGNGTYGELAAESPANIPGARYGSVQWNDAAGNVWLFGGQGKGETRTGSLNDLWRFNQATNMWAWMGGSREPNEHGTTDSATGQNYPGSRGGATMWQTADGDVWMFGGLRKIHKGQGSFFQPVYAIYRLNDLWRFDSASAQWQLVQDEKRTTVYDDRRYDSFFAGEATYGTLGQPDPANQPRGAEESVGWTDQQGNLWLFGGFGSYRELPESALAALWKFDPIMQTWTWMNGPTTEGTQSVYGPEGEFTAASRPGGKISATGWTDNDGNLVFMGGKTFQDTRNVLWTYNIASNTWKWNENDKGTGVFSAYGTPGVASESNFPGLRFDAMAWKDADGSVWIYGGEGYAKWGYGYLDDMWRLGAPVVRTADISIESVAVAPVEPVVGTEFAWSFVVRNNGPEIAETVSVSVTGDFGSRASISNVITSQGTFTASASGVEISLGTIAPAASASVTVYIKGNQPGALNYSASAAMSAAGVVDPAENNLIRTIVLVKQVVNPIDPEDPQPPLLGPDITGLWAPADVKLKTNKKGQTKGSLKANLMVANPGTETAGKSHVQFYLSADQVLDVADVELKSKKIGKLKSGKSKKAKLTLKLKAPVTGQYLIAVVDASGAVVEANENNNVIVSDSLP